MVRCPACNPINRRKRGFTRGMCGVCRDTASVAEEIATRWYGAADEPEPTVNFSDTRRHPRLDEMDRGFGVFVDREDI